MGKKIFVNLPVPAKFLNLQAACAKGELPKRDDVSFAYMWSADQNLALGIGH